MLTFLSPAPLVGLLLFLFASPASGLVFAGQSAEPLPAKPSRTPVVMVVFDELPVSMLMDRDQRIDAERYPSFGALARRSSWFRNDVAAADDTVQAVPALLTGNRSRRGQLPVHSARPRSIFTAFGNSHRLTGMEHATWLCPPSVCDEARSLPERTAEVGSALSLVYPHVIVPPGLLSRLGVELPDIGRTWGEALRPEEPSRTVAELIRATDGRPVELNRYPDAQFERFLRVIKSYEGSDGRAPFHLLHSSLPHYPWQFLPNGKVYAPLREQHPGRDPNTEEWNRNPALVQLGWQRHLLQARYADRQLGRLLAKLRETGLYDRALVVVTADHGASFVPGENRRFVSDANAPDIGLVPLIVKAPGQRRPRVLDRPVQSIDVLPTLADMLDVRVPWRIDGRSALDSAGRRSVEISSFHGSGLSTSPARLARRRADSLRRQIALFGTGAEGGGGFGVGPFHQLVGQRVSDLRSVARGRARARVGGGAIRSVDPASRYQPAARANGVISGGGRSVRYVAVALNGRIAGVAPTSGPYFTALLSNRWLRAGRNEVRVYRPLRTTRGTALQPLG
jgi:hypothetical protein